MILGVDHLAISTADAQSAADSLAEDGYQTLFVERSLPNHPSKKSLLRQFGPEHAVALCKHSRGVAIEWTQHETIAEEPGTYRVLLDHPIGDMNAIPWEEIEDATMAEVWRATGLAGTLCFADSSALESYCWMTLPIADGAGRGIRAVAILAPHLGESVRFWRDGLGLVEKGCGRTATGRHWTHLALQAVLSTWSIDVVLMETRSTPRAHVRAMLDDRGASCLALVSTEIDADLLRVREQGGDVISEPFELHVGGRNLRIALIRGPSGEIVELIQPAGGA